MKKKASKLTAIWLSTILTIQPIVPVWASQNPAPQEIPQEEIQDTSLLDSSFSMDPEEITPETISNNEVSDPSETNGFQVSSEQEDISSEADFQAEIVENSSDGGFQEELLAEDGSGVLLEGSTLYGNGTPIVIKKDSDGSVYVYDSAGTTKLLENAISNPENLTIYGGGKGTSVTSNVSITIDGVKVQNIYGGGYATAGSAADLTGDVSITLQNGASAGTIYGGGNGASVTGDISILLDGDGVTSTSLYGGGNNGKVNGNIQIQLHSAKVFSNFYGGGYANGKGNSDVSGNVTISIDGTTEVKKAYGGGYAFATSGDASANVAGDITVTIPATPHEPIGPDDHNGDEGAPQNHCHGDIYGGGYAYASNGHNASATCQSTDTYVNSVVKTITGGGYAQVSSTGTANASVSDAVKVRLTETDYRDAYMGGHAINTGATANCGSVNIEILEGNEIGSTCCGGTASGGASSCVNGSITAKFGNCSYIYGEIYGGGCANSNSIATCNSVDLSITDSAVPAYEQRPGWGVVSANIYGGGSANGSNANANILNTITLNCDNLQCAGYILSTGEAKDKGTATSQSATININDFKGYEYNGETYLPSIVTDLEWDDQEGTTAAPNSNITMSLTNSIVSDVWGARLIGGSNPASTQCTADLILDNTTITNTVTCFDTITLNKAINIRKFLYKNENQPTKLIPQNIPLGNPLIYCDDTDLGENEWFTIDSPYTLTYSLEGEEGNQKSVWRYNKTNLILSKDTLLLTVDDKSPLSASLPSATDALDITWTSNTPSVASVDENGIVTAVSPGTASITATLTGTDITASCEVTVAQKAPLPSETKIVIEAPANQETIKDSANALISNNPTYQKAFDEIDNNNTTIKDISLKDTATNQEVELTHSTTILIPYSEIFGSGTNIDYRKYVFSILHLLTGATDGTYSGQLVHYRALPEGLEITVNSLSPFVIGYKEATAENGLLHTLSFDPGNGTSIPEQKVAENVLATAVDDPVKSGYTFQGWYQDAAFTQAWDFNKDAVLQDTTLYAKWKTNYNPSPVVRYTVTFDSQGGTPVDPYIFYGGKIAEPEAPSKEGYLFTGWYKDYGCTEAWDFALNTVWNNITLYAGWKADTPVVPQPEKPAAPKLKVKSNTTSSITLTWNRVPDIAGYVIYGYSKAEGGKYTERKILGSSKTSVTLKYPQGTVRHYYIKAYRKVDGKNIFSKVSNRVDTATKPATAVIKSVVPGKGTAYVTLKTKAKGAEGYAYCVSTDGKHYRVVARGPRMPYKMKGLKKGTNYIKVRSYVKDHKGKVVYGSLSKAVKITVK
ncbi:MAG: InlB B-repeat-containing protein [Blautia sp.]|jgi:uncharacterized repeat protein (TIGR02543 family)